jgi:transcriptional regulator with XRE-family HTH domain
MSIEGCDEAAARILREARKKTGRTQAQIAEALGRQQSWLGKIERGEQGLHLGEFLAIADEIGIDWIGAIREARKAL